MNAWWGYLHTNGRLHVKRLFSLRDLEEAIESDFVAQVSSVVHADTRIEAVHLVAKALDITLKGKDE